MAIEHETLQNLLTGVASIAVLTIGPQGTSAEDRPNPMNYQGKSVEQWAEQLRSQDSELQSAAVAPLVSIGEPSVPYVREVLRDVDNPKARGRAIVVARKLGVTAKEALPELIACLSADEYFIRGWSSNAIGAMGPEAAEAVPAIVESFKTWNHDSKGHGFSALANIGPVAAPALITLMDDEDEEIRQMAASALGRMQPRVDSAVVRLEEAMENAESALRADAAFAHWRMTKETEPACDVLGQLLAETDRAVRHSAALKLLQMGPDAREAARELRDLASGEQDPAIREYAVKTLKLVDESSP